MKKLMENKAINNQKKDKNRNQLQHLYFISIRRSHTNKVDCFRNKIRDLNLNTADLQN